jgi:hypothetical protein
VIGSFALAGVGGAAVAFMLVFLRALLREAIGPHIDSTKSQFTRRRESIVAAPASIEHNSGSLDRIA